MIFNASKSRAFSVASKKTRRGVRWSLILWWLLYYPPEFYGKTSTSESLTKTLSEDLNQKAQLKGVKLKHYLLNNHGRD